jgi:lysophospholipase L1-like esterase
MSGQRALDRTKWQRVMIGMLLILLTGCKGSLPVEPSITPSPIASPSPTPTPPNPTRTLLSTEMPKPPLTIVFYGDSTLKVGDVDQQGLVGFSFVDDLRPQLDPDDNLVISNHGGRKAKWGYENLAQNVLSFQPDLVTLWWGMNDLGGCPGIFDRDTDKIIEYELDALLDEHIQSLKLQIEAMLDKHIPVIVMTPLPVLRDLLWSHLGPNNELIWEDDYRCDYNIGLEQLAASQRELVAGYSADQKPVYLLDVWQIYQDHPNTDKMYMDIVHPASRGAELIAEGWIQVFQSIER